MAERYLASGGMVFYRPAEVAKMLRCSDWWIKEQARRGRIPFSWIGGSYLFTSEHIVEIINAFERKPVDPYLTPTSPNPVSRPCGTRAHEPGIRLKARTPRRARSAQERQSKAA